VRSTGLRLGDVTRALIQHRTIVRTWLMRGTLHLVAGDDLGWLLAALGPAFAAGNRARHAQLGLDADLKARGIAAIRRILADSGPLTRYELVDRLRDRGIQLDPGTQAPIHLIQLAALEGVCCLGPEGTNHEATYVALGDWLRTRLEPSRSRESALAELARRYFRAYGPASVDDFVAWSGLSAGDARQGLLGARASLSEIRLGGRPAFMAKAKSNGFDRRSPLDVRLLPAFDTYLLGYRRRDLAVPPALQRRLQRGGGWLHPAIVVDGRAVAAWSLRMGNRHGQVSIDPSQPIMPAVKAGISREVADIARFLDVSIALSDASRTRRRGASARIPASGRRASLKVQLEADKRQED
jgi:Winged helix DNA-binding domain